MTQLMENVKVRISAEEHAALKAEAVRDDRTVSALIRRAVRAYLENVEPEPVASRKA
jgi:predicted DNA-binding protein